MIRQPLPHIHIQSLRCMGRHGVLPEEKKRDQLFLIDASCILSPFSGDGAAADDYGKALCYAALCDAVTAYVRQNSFNLIETLGKKLAEHLLETFPLLEEIRLEIRKPQAPLPHEFFDPRTKARGVGISLTRRREYAIGIGAGSNLGEREALLNAALDLLNLTEGLVLDRISGILETPPWGVAEKQPDYLNLCALGRTTLSPFHLLRILKKTELLLGRTPVRKWGARRIDLDLLFYGDLRLKTPVLTLPHPHLFDREFVISPLLEIAPDLEICGKSLKNAKRAHSNPR